MIELYSTTSWYAVDYSGLKFTVSEITDCDSKQKSYEVLHDGNAVSKYTEDAVIDLLKESQKQTEGT